MPSVRTPQSAHAVNKPEMLPGPAAALDPALNPAGPLARPVVDAVLDVRQVTSLVFESYREGEEWRWRLRADGFRLLAESDARFATMRDCERAIVIVRAQARFAHTHLRQDADGRWRWWLLGGEGRVLARSAVVYTTRFICAMEVGLLRPAIIDAVSLRSVANKGEAS
jgi:uncharacterized protein YegP (UPF0339 family)